MGVLVIEKEKCPYCGYLLKSDVRVNQAGVGTSIGSQYAKCPKCNNTYDTGNSEWTEKSKEEKHSYYLNMYFTSIIWPLFIGGISGLLCISFLPIYDDETLIITSITIGSIVFGLGFYVLYKSFKSEIQESIKSSNSEIQ